MTTQLYKKLTTLLVLAFVGLAFGQTWNWTDITVPDSNKGGHGDQDWAAAANWGDGTSGYPLIASDSALSDAYTFNQSILRWQWIRLPALNQQPGGYLGTLQGGFHNSIVLTSTRLKANRLFMVANPNDYVGDWMIDNASDSVGASSGFILPATDSFTPVLQRVRITGDMQFKVATGGTAELAYPFGEGSFGVNKSIDGLSDTAGTLAITRSPGPRTEMRVYGGAVSLTGRTYTGVPTCVPGAALHLDASKVDSLTVEGGIVTEWRDADGGARMAIQNGSMNRPRLHAGYANGLPIVDFGVQKDSSTKIYGDPAILGDPSCLKLDSTLEGIREFFVVFADTTSTNASASIVNANTYARSSTPGRLFSSDVLSDRSSYAAIETADLSVDGQASSQDLVADDFSKGLHVVAVSHRGDYRGVLSALGIRDPDTINKYFGGVRIAEVIAYASALTPDQRRQNIAYLRRKWQPAEVAKDLDYGAVTVAGESVIDVADGTTVEVGTLTVSAGASKLVKTGGGTLVIDSYLSPDVEVEVHGGAVKFASSAVYATPAKASDPLVWLDANTLTESTVTEWADARGTDAISASREDDTYPAARLDTTTVEGLQMVDMGAAFSQEDDSTYFLIKKKDGTKLGNDVRCGFMVYYKNVSAAVVPSSAGNALRVTSGSASFISDLWANAFAVGGRWSLDGYEIIPTSCNNGAGEVHVIGFRFASNLPVDMLGADRDATTSKDDNNRGGIKFGEVLLYDRPLTDAEWKETESYLLKKWKNAAHPADLAAAEALTLAYVGDADNVFDVDENRELAGVTLNPTKPLVKRGDGALVLPSSLASTVPSCAVEGGSLIASVEFALKDVLSRAYYHGDAMDASSLATRTDNDVIRVDRWDSASGQSVSAVPYNSSQDEDSPILSDVTINGLARKVVDFGAFGAKASTLPADGTSYGMTIGSAAAPLAELHYVVCDSDSSDHTSLGTRTAVIGSTGQRADLVKNTYPIYRGSSGVLAATGQAAAFAYGETWLNGESVTAHSTTPDFQRFYQVTMVPTGTLSVAWTLARRTANEIGGLKVGEVVMFAETNAVSERAAVDAYLAKKWLGTGDGCLQAFETLSARFGSALRLSLPAGMTASASTLAGGGIVDVDDVRTACVTVGDDSTMAGTLTVDGNLTLANGATLNVDLSSATCDKLVVSGWLKLSDTGVVQAELIPGAERLDDEYVIAEAAGGIVRGSLRDWTVNSTTGVSAKLRIVDGTKLVLDFKSRGFSLIVR